MNQDKLKETLDKIPVGLLVACFIGYLGWDYYTFTNASDSPLIIKHSELESVKKENAALTAKVNAANDFFKHLEQKREEVRRLAQQLDDLKTTVPSEVDVPGFMKTVLTEAKRVGINVFSIKPAPITNAEYYEEHPFDLGFRGVYVQLVVFLEHLANLQNIARVDSVDIHPVGNSSSKYVELEGSVQIKTYRYLGTKADNVIKSGAGGKPSSSDSGNVPAAASKGGP